MMLKLSDFDRCPLAIDACAALDRWAFQATPQVLPAMNLQNIRVFVTDGYWRKTLAAVRALGRAGLKVTVGESTYLAPAFFSRYCHTRIRTPSPVLQPSGYLDFL
jgi:hypothetical protein